MTTARVEYKVNPRFVPDDIPVWFGNSKDAAIIYDNANGELTVQTKNLAGTLTDRIRIEANKDSPVGYFDLLGGVTIGLAASAPRPRRRECTYLEGHRRLSGSLRRLPGHH